MEKMLTKSTAFRMSQKKKDNNETNNLKHSTKEEQDTNDAITGYTESNNSELPKQESVGRRRWRKCQQSLRHFVCLRRRKTIMRR